VSDEPVSQVTWSAAEYDALPLPHEEWGRLLVDALPLAGTETVVDIGAGTGRDAARALTRLPNGRVICLDGSAEMRARCATRFTDEPRVLIDEVDLRGRWPLPDESADVVMSVATLHWLSDHRPVLSEAARVLKRGGLISVDCGGAGNIEAILDAVTDIGADANLPTWYYAGAEDTEDLLREMGLEPLSVRLRAAPASFADRRTFEAYLQTLILHRCSGDDVRRVADRIPRYVVDYVRLEFTARKP
jgi:trans-aconitate 2-methyltransferase